MRHWLTILIPLLLFSSCRILTVHRKGEKVKGIPFYTYKAITEQKTQRLYAWYEVQLIKIEELEDSKEKKTTIIERKISRINGTALATIKAKLLLSPIPKDTIYSIVEQLNDFVMVGNNPSDPQKEVDLIYNNWANKKVIDYSTPYYINGKMPWFGTASLSQKLSSDGTLSEASATTDSQLDELVGAVIGLATPLTSVTVAEIQAEAQVDVANIEQAVEILSENIKKNTPFSIGEIEALRKSFEVPSNIRYELHIKPAGYIYTFTKITDPITPYSTELEAIPFNLQSGNYTRTVYPSKPASKKKDDKPTIEVSGSIKLPESK